MKPVRRVVLLAIAMVTALIPTAPAAIAATGPVVFVNEFHYDNAGTDEGEAIEIAGPAGTDLTGWSIVLYNGSNGTAYGTSTLSGTLADQQSGYGFRVVTYPSNGIQNGSPDGIALIDSSSAVVQFLSYEGSFTAVGGPANGMTSTDIGVSESGSDPIGNSLQLTGSGTHYGDFAWAAAQPNTFGAVNTNQTFSGAPRAPSVVINEVDYDQADTDTAEFVELKNVGTTPADLTSLTLELVNGSGGGAAVYNTIALPAVSLAPGDYFVICANAATVANCDLDSSPDTNFIQNGAPDGIGLRFGTELIDAVSYEGDTGAPYTEGSGSGLVDPSVTDAGLSRCPDGADTGQNNIDFLVVATSPGSANACSGPAEPVINEFSASTTGTDVEYIELYGEPGADLSGLTVLEIEGDSASATGTVDEVLAGVVLDASGLGLISLPANALENGTITLLLVEGFTGVFGDDLDTDDDGVLDVTPWSAVIDDVAVFDGGTGDLTYASTVLGPNYDGLSSFAPGGASRIPDGTDTDTSADWARNDFDLFGIPGIGGSPQVGEAVNTPGAPNELIVPPPTGFCGAPATLISAIQGDGAVSPLVGQTHTIEGVVVGDFQDAVGANGDLNGFYVQEEDSDSDGEPATSEGIFVFQGPNPSVDVANGDRVRVVGNVSEFFDSTQISATGVLVCGPTAAPTAATVTLPVGSVDDLEAFEGMAVTFPQTLTISEFFNFDRFGEIVLSTERLFQPTAVFEPGSPEAAAAADLISRSRITLDDGRTSQNPDPAIHPNGLEFGLSNLFRGGDTVANVTGVLDYSFGLYRIQPTQSADYTSVNARPATPDAVGGSMTVAAFNVLNYFNTLDDGVNDICGPAGDQECRGADNETERFRQLDKIVSAMSVMNADVLGIIEVENTTGVEAMADIVDGLNAIAGPGTYAYIDTGTVGSDAIKVGFIYQPGSVTPVGDYAVLDDPAFVAPFGVDRNRAALAQTFVENATGGKFTAVVNHFKSKGSPCGPGDDDPEAGSCNLTRTVSALVLADWLATDPTGSGDPDVMIIGDLNSYDKEDPIDVLRAAGYADLLFDYQGEFAYSYVFNGQLGYLDYGMANASLAAQVTGATAWHINADEADLIDYDTSFKQDAQDAIYAPDAYRSSDHDPVIVGLDLNASPVCDEAVPSIDSIWPPNHQMVDIEILGCTDADGDAITITIDSVFQDEPVNADDDGNTAPDGDGVGTSIAQVRAERSGEGDGRVYHIAFTATDAFGNTTTGEVTVEVRLSRKTPAVDDGAIYDSTIVP